MLDTRKMIYSMGPVGMAYEYWDTGKIKPDPLGIAGWQLANAGAMYTATRWLTGEGQTFYSVYKPVVQEELKNLRTAIRGSSKKPPMGVFGTLAFGLDVALQIEQYLESFNPNSSHQLM